MAKLEAKRDRQREERGWKPDEEEDGGIEFGGAEGENDGVEGDEGGAEDEVEEND